MKFEILNDKGKVVFQCSQTSCIPTKQEIESMTKNGYKIRIDGKVATKKRIKELHGEGGENAFAERKNK